MSQFLCVFEILTTPGSLSRSLDPRRNTLSHQRAQTSRRGEPRLAEGVATAGYSTTDHHLPAPARRDFLAVARRHPRRAGRRSEFSAPPLSARWSFSALLQPARTPSPLAAAALHGTGPRWTRNSPPSASPSLERNSPSNYTFRRNPATNANVKPPRNGQSRTLDDLFSFSFRRTQVALIVYACTGSSQLLPTATRPAPSQLHLGPRLVLLRQAQSMYTAACKKALV